jgi:CHAT domain-containing protein/tetratricopeptide (TPR) repeat protein
MAALPRCLCLLLTLLMIGWRPSALIKTGSRDAGQWWGSKEAFELKHSARLRREAGDYASAEAVGLRGYQLAQQRHDDPAIIGFLIIVGGCRLAQFHYRGALDSFLEARKLAKAIGDQMDLGALAVNLSSLYLQVWDFDSALNAAEEGRAASAGLNHPYFEAGLLLQLARLHEALRDGQTDAMYTSGIEAARAQGDIAMEASGWDLMGADRLARGDLSGAERALDEAFRLRAMYWRSDLPFSYARLGALKLAQGDVDTAGRLTEVAVAGSARVNASLPPYMLRHQRGQIRLARGEIRGALRDFRSAVVLAAEWRREVPPAAASLIAANVELARRVFDSFIVASARVALRTGSRRWVEESFEAVEANRAASLRESLALSEEWRKKLPPEYWELLGEMRAERGRLARAGGTETALVRRLKLKLSEMEAQVGPGYMGTQAENFHKRSSLIDFQKGLGRSEILLSFYLGTEESYLWAVTRQTISVHRLPAAGKIRSAVEQFRSAVRGSASHGEGDREPDWREVGREDESGESERCGEQFYRDLFGELRPEETGKETWLLSVDDALFELPFAALVTERGGGQVNYLVQKHVLQVIPGALLLGRAPVKPENHGFFLGVGDPIYNAADPRWNGGSTFSKGAWLGWFDKCGAGETPGQLNRLVGSASEIESSTRSWSTDSVLLEGAEARRDRFLQMQAHGPSVIHLATHVLTPRGQRGESVIAFGLGKSQEPEYLTTSEIAMLRVPGALVTMSGCGTAMGEFRAGAGLLGLARAWELAGASGVVATKWPVSDSKGEILTSFYHNLRRFRDSRPPGTGMSGTAAAALRRGQLEMIESGTWRASPAYWAAYELTGGAH